MFLMEVNMSASKQFVRKLDVIGFFQGQQHLRRHERCHALIEQVLIMIEGTDIKRHREYFR